MTVVALGFLLRRSNPERYRLGETADWRWLLLFAHRARNRFGAMVLPITMPLVYYALATLIGRLTRPR